MNWGTTDKHGLTQIRLDRSDESLHQLLEAAAAFGEVRKHVVARAGGAQGHRISWLRQRMEIVEARQTLEARARDGKGKLAEICAKVLEDAAKG